MTRLLEMANNLRGVYQMSCLTEEGSDSGRNDNGFDLTMLARRTSEYQVAGPFGHRKGFSCESRLKDGKQAEKDQIVLSDQLCHSMTGYLFCTKTVGCNRIA